MKVEEVYAFVVIDGDGEGGEGIPALNCGGMALPMLGADMERIDSLRQYANDIAEYSGKSIELRKFSNMEVLETFKSG